MQEERDQEGETLEKILYGSAALLIHTVGLDVTTLIL